MTLFGKENYDLSTVCAAHLPVRVLTKKISSNSSNNKINWNKARCKARSGSSVDVKSKD